jgi:hypothetical protein
VLGLANDVDEEDEDDVDVEDKSNCIASSADVFIDGRDTPDGARGADENPLFTGDESSAASSTGGLLWVVVVVDGGLLKGTGSALPSSMPISVSILDSTDFTKFHSELIFRQPRSRSFPRSVE